MNNKRNIKEELEEISPFLAEIKKEGSPFTIPEGYFAKMQDEVFQKVKKNTISQQEQSSSTFQKIITDSIHTIQTLMLRHGRYLMPAASFLFLITIGAVYLLKPVTDTPTVTQDAIPLFADISIEEMDLYIEENIDEFEIEELVDLVDIETIAEVESTNINTIETSKNELLESELDDYIDEIIDDFDIEELEDISNWAN